MTSPKISVVMCAYNAERYIESALNSILAQTFRDFEFIIVDDGSTDRTAEILARRAARDARIKVLTNDANMGIPHSTNRGLAAACGDYIARMDSDDIALPTRFAKQVRHLDTHHDCLVVGTGYQEINANGDVVKTDCQPASPSILRWRALFRMPFIHSSIMFRGNSIRKHSIRFDETLVVASDFDFTQRLLRTGEAALIPEPLIQYRMHPKNVSTRKRRMQRDAARRASIREAGQAFPELSQEKLRDLFAFIQADGPATLVETFSAAAAMQDLQYAFARRHMLSKTETQQQRALATRWLAMTILRRQPFFGAQSSLIHLFALRSRLPALLGETARYCVSRRNIFNRMDFSDTALQE